jgi:hypothetical protein
MTAFEVYMTLSNHLKTLVTTDIAWEGRPYTPKRGTPFVRPILQAPDSEVIGPSCVRVRYLYTVQVFYPYGQGVEEALKAADVIAAGFRGFRTGDLTVHSVHIDRGPEEEEWCHRLVLIEVTNDER